MIDFKNISNLYFIGIGGIGMSALARYAQFDGKNVAGYDLTKSDLTQTLEREGIAVHYSDDPSFIPTTFTPENTLVVRTPAVPDTLSELNYFIDRKFSILKRSQLLGFLTSSKKCIAVSGTHGKTSVSIMSTLLLRMAQKGAGAFLGGISRNFDSNLVLPEKGSELVVAEADEFDRSFLQLHPTIAVVTAIDADHLDIYGTYEAVREAFGQFIGNIKPNGTLIVKAGVDVTPYLRNDLNVITYSIDQKADVFASDLHVEENAYHFNLNTPNLRIENLVVNYPGRVNVENFVAASAVALSCGCSEEAIRSGMVNYKGVQRRFDIRYRGSNVLYIDDYAHHPAELAATINSVRELYAGKRILGIFQPHLYTRTRDFADGFAQSLDLLDEAVLLEIYPARELPIEGVNSALIASKMKNRKVKVIPNDGLKEYLMNADFDLLLTMGAGSIDRLIVPICEILKEKENKKNLI